MYRQRGLVPVSTNASNTLSTTGGAITINYAKDAAFLAIQKNQRKSIEEFMVKIFSNHVLCQNSFFF
jgi:hypothetical protein